MKIHSNKLFVLFTCFFIILLASCGKNKHSQSNLLESTDEGERFAASSFGSKTVVLAKGDLNGNGNKDIFTAEVNKELDGGKYWIKNGGIVENSGDWRVILSFDKKLSSTKGELINQIDADNGYIISFDSKEVPMNIYITIADSAGKSVSDEAMLKWNQSQMSYEFIPNPGIPNNSAP